MTQSDNTSPELELIDIVDNFIHAITRRHIPDYPEAPHLLKFLNQWHQQQTIAVLERLQKDAILYQDSGVSIEYVPLQAIDNEIAKLKQHEAGDER